MLIDGVRFLILFILIVEEGYIFIKVKYKIVKYLFSLYCFLFIIFILVNCGIVEG